MVREKDLKKLRKILLVLSKNPEGLWLRQLAKESGLALSTIHYYINTIIDDITVSLGVKDKTGRYFGLRIIRLKPKIQELVEKGEFDKIYKFLKLSNKI